MPRPNKRDRLFTVFAWMEQEFPIRRHPHLYIRRLDKKYQGYVIEDAATVAVYLDDRLPLYAAIDCLLHEWSHVKSRRTGHGLEFQKWNAKIEEEFWKWRKSRLNS